MERRRLAGNGEPTTFPFLYRQRASDLDSILKVDSRFYLERMDIRIRSRGRLPHWTRPDTEYFITFRTIDSVSPEWLASLRVGPWTPDEKRRLIEESLDGCTKGTILRGNAAECVASSILYGHQRDYHLHAWCVMPNHVHLLLRPTSDARISPLIQSLKSITAHNLNKLLGRSGPVWEREYFDRLVRPGKFETVRNYILRNPRAANLSKLGLGGEY